MVSAFLIPIPFLLVTIYALLAKRSKTIGYVGSIAGIISLFIVWSVWQQHGVKEVVWFTVAGTQFAWSVMIDQLSLLLSAIVAGIGTFIFLYSVGYLEHDEEHNRYYAELALFAAAMLGVVTSANLFQLFFCWELVGVSSYLLIGFWHQKESAIAAARKAFTMIIIGDAFLLTGVLLLWKVYGTFDIQTLLTSAQLNTLTVAAGSCIIMGAISKSAQFPLHTWLPDAMEGPTPVSAFLHSATMVKAGLFLIARMLPLLVIAGLSPILIVIAAITIIISGCCALVENDIKRVLAYSTMNQLAFILLAFGLGAMTAGLFHLLNHSIFKALLFMAAGVIIHLAGTQDMRGMKLKLGWNILAVTTLVGALALAGLPPFSGFFSKDAIFDAVLATHNAALIVLFCAAIFISAAYIFRWYFLIFKREGSISAVHWQMKLPLPVLATLTVMGGLVMLVFYSWWSDAVPEFGIATLLSVLLAGSGFLCAYFIYYKRSWSIESWAASPLAELFRRRFFFDDIYTAIARFVMELGAACHWIDEHIINWFLEHVAIFSCTLGGVLRRSISGRVSTYITAIIIGFLLLTLAVRFL